MNYTVITDTCCDMPNEMYQSLKLKVVTLSLLYKGVFNLSIQFLNIF